MKKALIQPFPLFLLLLLALWFCDKEFNGERPFARLLTHQPSDLNDAGVTLNAEFLDLSGDRISDFGFYIDSNNIGPIIAKNPDILKYSLQNEGAKVGKFSYRLESNLAIGTIYYVRAYAYQGNSLILGEEFAFRSRGGAKSPIISGFTPNAIVAGDTLTVSGRYFLLGAPKISVKLGGENAQIIGSVTDTQLKILAPLGLPPTGKLELMVGSINLTSDQTYQRLKPTILSAPSTMKYGTSYLVECQNLNKFRGSNMMQIGSAGNYQYVPIIQENKNTLLIKLDENANYNFTPNDSLRLKVENFIDRKKVSLQNPVLSSISPNKGIAEDEISLQVEGVSANKDVTKINWNGSLLAPALYSIAPGGTNIRIQIPYTYEYPQEVAIAIQVGQLRSNVLKLNLEPKLVNLTQSEKNWHYAFSLNDRVYLGTRASSAPLLGIEPLKPGAVLEPVTSSGNESFEYAFPTLNAHVIGLSLGSNGGLNGHFLEILANNTIRQLSKSNNAITLAPNATEPGLIRGVATGNEQGYVYVANGSSNFWNFNSSNGQFKALAPVPSLNNTEASDIVLLNPDSKILAVVTYPDRPMVYVMEYSPSQNFWKDIYSFNFGSAAYLDAFVYPFKDEPGIFFLLSTKETNRYSLCVLDQNFVITLAAFYNKLHNSSKKKTFLIKGNLIVVDDESIYRNKITN